MTTLTLPSRDAWLSARRIGGSDVAAILGRSPYRTAWDVYARLVDGEPSDRATDATRRGHMLEPLVLREYARAVGVTVQRPAPFTLWQREDFATASVDALVHPDGIVEAKTSRYRDGWGDPQTIEQWTPEAAAVVRTDYALQSYWYLWVLDRAWCDLAVLLPGDDPFVPELRVYRLVRDREAEAAIVDAVRAWWQRHVVERVPPDLDGGEAAGRHLARRERSGARAATPQEVALAAAYQTARAHADAWDWQRRLLGQQLVAAAGDASRLDLPVGRVSIVRSSGRATLDERALLAEHPELATVLDQYRRTSAPTVYPKLSGLEK